MSAVAAKPQAGGAMNPTAMAVGVVMLLIILALCYFVSPGAGLMALVGVLNRRWRPDWIRYSLRASRWCSGSNGAGTRYRNRCSDACSWCWSRRALRRRMGC